MVEKVKSDKIEREYVIPLREKVRVVPRYKKTPKAVKTIKEFLARHMRVKDRDLKKIKIDKHLNELLWRRGIKNPPHKIKVRAIKDSKTDIVRVEAITLPEKIKFKKLREEKYESKAKESAEKKKSLMEKAKESLKPSEKKEEDKNKDGLKDSEESKIKEEASKQAEEKIEKQEATAEKHTTKEKSPKEKKDMRTGYNKSSRGR